MKSKIFLLPMLLFVSCSHKTNSADPLPSWNDAPAKNAIVTFVTNAADAHHPQFIPVSERIAVFDNDGTLWCEQPLYTEMVFSLDAQEALTGRRPDLSEDPGKAIETAFVVSHSGMSSDRFAALASAWIDTASHVRFGAKYTALAYQPMVELLDYLRANGFKTYIVSGGSSAFMRTFAEQTYGVPAEQVIGTMMAAEFVASECGYSVIYKPEMWHSDDKGGKPVAIEQLIGRKPVLAFGNSDGDLQMLQWTSSNRRPNLCLLLHHTDSVREYAYDSLSTIGTLREALREADRKGWIVVDMKSDFRTVFSFE